MEERNLGRRLLKFALAGMALTAAGSAIWLTANRLSLRSFTADASARAFFKRKRRWDLPERLFPEIHSIWIGFAAGLIGAASALLTSPTSGKELRKKIKSQISAVQLYPAKLSHNSSHPLKIFKKKRAKKKIKVAHN